MCGLVYVLRKDGKPAYKAVLKRYQKQKNRGTEGYGYVAVKDNKVVSYKRATTEHEIRKMLEKEDAPEILFHHRNPTSTPNIEESAHPLLVSNPILDTQFLIAHNGVIRNDDDLKKAHEELGFKYETEIISGFRSVSSKKFYTIPHESKFNDSEAVAIETALAISGNKKRIDTEGGIAIIGFEVKDDMVVRRFFYHNMNPLVYVNDRDMTTLTSVGKGKDVECYKLQEFTHNGEYRAMDIDTPWVSKHYSGFPQPINYSVPPKSQNLPAVRSHFDDFPVEGFGRVPLDLREYDDMTDDLPGRDFMSLKDLIGSSGHNKDLLEVSTAQLWDMYAFISDKVDETEKKMQTIEAMVANDMVDDELMTEHTELTESLVKYKEVKSSLDKELTIRETLEDKLSK